MNNEKLMKDNQLTKIDSQLIVFHLRPGGGAHVRDVEDEIPNENGDYVGRDTL